MKFLIVGFGSIGRRHFRNLLSLGYEDIIFYRSHKSSLECDELEGFPVETSLESALAHEPDAVVVSNPTALHLDVAIPAAKAGCHILLEKPISHNMNRVAELQEAAEKSGSRILMGFQYRFHPGLRRIKRWLAQEAIGRPLSARVHWGEYLPNWHPWENYQESFSARADLGGGVLLTLSHPLDYLRWLLGEIDSVWAYLGYNSDLELNGVEDTAEIGFRFTNGVTGSLHLNYVQRPPSHWLEIIGTEGTIRWNAETGVAKCYNIEEKTWEEFPLRANFERNDLYISEMKHFVAVVMGQFVPICSLEDGVAVQKIVQGAKQSSEQGLITALEVA
ncbi:MAG: hypothetical protein DRI56_08170 [Chloroflexota bacterium]|nr:MAG: hypothetical protein DRI56_08170 [Chloroflexota bacterium]